MGVPGLWDLIRPAAARVSLSALARDGFIKNNNGLRAFTIGIDASIWMYHAQIPVGGENPFLRIIFYKITSLLQQPVLPVFVFDGPEKPRHKRNQTVGRGFGSTDARSKQFKELLDECGLEWWNAPGEAEAELAVMNKQGKIDAVLSDDVDALLFGATCLLRNNSSTLSGAQASTTQTNTKVDSRSYEVFRSSAITEHWVQREGTTLITEDDCRMAMILVALLAGGDYVPEGIKKCGPTIAFALANAGHASILKLYQTDPLAFRDQLPTILTDLVEELRTDASNQVGMKQKALAASISAMDPSAVFPTLALDAYLNPSTSPLSDPSEGWPGFENGTTLKGKRGMARNGGRGDMEGLARACERFFEWGTRERVVKKFANETVNMFGAHLVNTARETIRAQSPIVRPSESFISPVTTLPSSQKTTSRITGFFPSVFRSTPPSNKTKSARGRQLSPVRVQPQPVADVRHNISKIASIRSDPTNSDIKEYRVSYSHELFSDRIRNAMLGYRPDPQDLPTERLEELGLVGKERTTAETSSALPPELRTWIPDYLVEGAWPELIVAYNEHLESRVKSSTTVKKVSKSTTTKKGKSEITVEESQAFIKFFAKIPDQPEVHTDSVPASTMAVPIAQKAVGKKLSKQQSAIMSSDEEVEEVEDRPSVASTISQGEASRANLDGQMEPIIAEGIIKKTARTSTKKQTAMVNGVDNPTEASQQVQALVPVKVIRTGKAKATTEPIDLSTTPSSPILAFSKEPDSVNPVAIFISPIKKSRPHPPTSSISSLSSIEATTSSPPIAALSPSRSIPSPGNGRSRKVKTSMAFSALPRVSSKRAVRAPSSSLTPPPSEVSQSPRALPSAMAKPTSMAEPIDLCSTDEDTPRPTRTRKSPVSAASTTRTNISAKTFQQKSPKKKTRTTKEVNIDLGRELTLDLPVLALPVETPLKKMRKKKERYIVISETESEEELDLTMGHGK